MYSFRLSLISLTCLKKVRGTENMNLKVGGFIETSVAGGPGIRSVLFL